MTLNKVLTAVVGLTGVLYLGSAVVGKISDPEVAAVAWGVGALCLLVAFDRSPFAD